MRSRCARKPERITSAHDHAFQQFSERLRLEWLGYKLIAAGRSRLVLADNAGDGHYGDVPRPLGSFEPTDRLESSDDRRSQVYDDHIRRPHGSNQDGIFAVRDGLDEPTRRSHTPCVKLAGV